MKNAPFALLLALPLLAATRPATAPVADTPRFAVEEGTVLKKVFEQSFDITLDSFTMSVDGNEMATDGFDLSMEQGSKERVELSDTYVSMLAGKPGKLKRTFSVLTGSSVSETSSMQGDETKEDEESSELEGQTVVFTWDEDAEEYATSFHESDADEDLLDDLEEDTDLRAFLPKGEVAEGDTWEIKASAFAALFSPGGDVKLVGENDEDDDEEGLDEQFEENLSGEVTATFKGTRDADGVKVAVIEIAGELSSEAEEEVDEGPGEGSMTASIDFDVEGQLLWNLKGGHFASLELSATIDMTMNTEMTIQDTHEMQQSMNFTGSLTFNAKATPE